MERQVLLTAADGLVGVDLGPAYRAVQAGSTFPGMVARFKKKENLGNMTKSILKHKIQTLTGKNVKTIEEEMKYKPKDPNEPSMDVDTMRSLAGCLILLSNGELPHTNGAVAEVVEREEAVVKAGRKRAPDREEESAGSKAKVTNASVRRGRKSLAVLPSQETVVDSPTPRAGKRKSLSSSVVMSSCPSPPRASREKLVVLEEEAEPEPGVTMAVLEEEAGVSNPTPMMVEMLKKRQSVGGKSQQSAGPKTPLKSRTDKILGLAKEKVTPVKPPPSPGPRSDFPGRNGAKAYLVAGQPMELRYPKLLHTLPLAADFPGAHLTVVHTPSDWGPHEIFSITTQVKKLNKEAGLNSFVLLVGTGLGNLHMNMEALGRHTKHTQFITFHRADANLGKETGKLRETCSYFLVAYFFPKCDEDDSTLPSKMVRDGFSTCFMTGSTVELESSIIQCFSEAGEWLLDIACGSRQLSVAAVETGRSAVCVHAEPEPLEDLGNYLRTLALENDKNYRDKDGVLLTMA